MQGKRDTDRRIQRTRRSLHQAFAALIREKAYDRITVTDILERADVGRSTFYMHFRDKDELLISSIGDLLGSFEAPAAASGSTPRDALIGFSRPVFEHIHSHRRRGDAIIGPRGRAVIHERLGGILAKRIAARLGPACGRGRKTAPPLPPELLAQYIASTFILVLNWWVESRNPPPPAEADRMFRHLVLPVLVPARE